MRAVNIPKDSAPLPAVPSEEHSTFQTRTELPAPDDPAWGVLSALFIWFLSFAFLTVVPVLLLSPYVLFLRSNDQPIGESLLDDWLAVFISVLGVIPAHLLTLAAIWAVVTQFGRKPFWQSVGWSWSPNFGFWKSAGLAVLLLVVGTAITRLFGGQETQVDKIISSSLASRYTLALLAATTAPLVEELVYRGVLYPALQKAIGVVWSILIVSALFSVVHVSQYYNNLSVIGAVTLLSVSLTLVRAYTGRVLPCVVIHFMFNGIQSVFIALEPYIRRYLLPLDATVASVLSMMPIDLLK